MEDARAKAFLSKADIDHQMAVEGSKKAELDEEVSVGFLTVEQEEVALRALHAQSVSLVDQTVPEVSH